MRSSRPIPGNPWPHDMVITISDDAEALLELLWVRAAWRLQPTGPDIPPAAEGLPDIPASSETLRRSKGHWERAWVDLWPAALDHLATPRDPDALDVLRDARAGSAERLELLTALRGPSWRDRFGSVPFDDAYREWRRVLVQESIASHARPLSENPERVCLDPLVAAWRRGLTTVILIPCVGSHTRTVGEHALLTTRAVRGRPDRYAEALRSFGLQ